MLGVAWEALNVESRSPTEVGSALQVLSVGDGWDVLMPAHAGMCWYLPCT